MDDHDQTFMILKYVLYAVILIVGAVVFGWKTIGAGFAGAVTNG